MPKMTNSDRIRDRLLRTRAFGAESSNRNIEEDIDTASEADETLKNIVSKRMYSNDDGFFMERARRNSQTAVGPIVKLPPELLLLVFSHVTSKSDLLSLALTCKAWAELTIQLIWFRPSITSEAIFRKIGRVMQMPVQEASWNYRLYVKRLNLSVIPNLVTNDFLGMFNHSKNLERLTLVNCDKLHSSSIASVLTGCSRLQSLDVSGVKDVSDDLYQALALNCPRLQGLYAPNSDSVSKEAVLALVRNCPLLKRLKLSECSEIDDEVIMELIKCCPNIVELELHGCNLVTNESLVLMFEELEYLREFKISRNSNVTDACFDTASGELSLDRLRILDFTSCENITDKAIEKLVKYAPRLRNVVLSKCVMITDSALRSLAQLGKNLHYVHLGHCSNITDYGAIHLIKSCHRLQYLDFACCVQLTDETLIELAQLSRLRRIGLVKCGNITDEGILALANHGRSNDDSLERVHLSYCTGINIYPIYKLLTSCPKLTHLSLTGVFAFLRPDIMKFCRDPPADFSPHQKSSFCVFSGEGVALLRRYLSQLMCRQVVFVDSSGQPYQNNHNLPRLHSELGWMLSNAPMMPPAVADDASDEDRQNASNTILYHAFRDRDMVTAGPGGPPPNRELRAITVRARGMPVLNMPRTGVRPEMPMDVDDVDGDELMEE
ncbi:unnamed protein product [Kuraishia capsulata CBS 1993]|uniref:F-box domain-containing protein n=1 Tax=Kuraishia capsulata CBS 1993 TaxID=1382522 RepID=W6MK36_9ASCO|nr:uncharacterized protein KUCA_T00002325001 [Kuraishia capsulata CBS 1993]CDK26353.1 unnamed protein product [Kuraishia capsulata CBS 1993]